MKSTLAWLMILCVCGAFIGLWIIGLPDKPPKLRQESDEIQRLKQEIRYRDAIIRRQAEIIASKRE